MWPKIFVFLNVIYCIVIAKYVGDSCVPNNEIADGICTLVTECEPAINELMSTRSHGFRRCGFNGDIEIVCCPPTIPKFGGPNERSSMDDAKRIAERECQKIIANNIEPLDQHITGGVTASMGEFPYMVGLGYDQGNGYIFNCGGSVLSSTYVLTAAHCVDNLEGIEPTIVRTGVIEIGGSTWDPESDVTIAQINMHPEYTHREKYHDLALLRLANSLSFSSTLNAICLDTNAGVPTTPLTVTGWGVTNSTLNTRSTLLLKANVSVVSTATCRKTYTATGWRKLPRGITAEQICAGDPAGIKDTCQGDSGGPLAGSDAAGHYRLVGVTSFGRGCGSSVPGVYTRVYSYLQWITGVVWTR